MLKAITSPKSGSDDFVIYADAAPTTEPYNAPKIAPTIISLKISGKVLVTSTRPVASPLTIIVDDCVPILPPIPMITGMKAASIIICSKSTLK